ANLAFQYNTINSISRRRRYRLADSVSARIISVENRSLIRCSCRILILILDDTCNLSIHRPLDIFDSYCMLGFQVANGVVSVIVGVSLVIYILCVVTRECRIIGYLAQLVLTRIIDVGEFIHLLLLAGNGRRTIAVVG